MKNTYCLQITIIGMVLTGVWLPKSLENSVWKPFYYFYAAFYQLFLFWGLLIIELKHLYLVRNNIEMLADVSLLLLTHLAQLAKVVSIWWHQKQLKKLILLLESPVFTSLYPCEQRILENCSRVAFIVSKTLAIASIFTGLMFGIFPLLQPILAVPLGYPYLDNQTTLFKVMYGYQLLCIVFNAIGDTAEDFLAGGLMALISGQLDVLDYKLKNVVAKKTEGNGGVTNDDYSRAIDCIKLHQNIISFVKELDKIFGIPAFCQFLATCIIMGLTAFKIAVSHEPTEKLTMVFYLLCIVAELFLYCFAGNVVTNKCKQVVQSAYCSDWTNTNIKTQKVLLMIMLRAQSPISISAGKMFDLTLRTFVMIVKSSYSYYAVLKQTKEM